MSMEEQESNACCAIAEDVGDGAALGKTKSVEVKKAKALYKRDCALKELISTEEIYLKNLELVVNGYMKEIHNKEIPRPEDLQSEKMQLVFNNIEEIYEWHRDIFMEDLRECRTSPTKLGPLMTNSATSFNMYYYYCDNKPLSQMLVKAHSAYFEDIQKKLKHSLDLNSLLIAPVQRVGRYCLFFAQLLVFTEDAGLHSELPSLIEADQQMKIVGQTVNSMMNVLDYLKDFRGDITAQGNLMMQGILRCSKDAGRRQSEQQVFLFQQIIIFADIKKKAKTFSDPVYKYRTHIQLNHMHMEPLQNRVNSFRVKSISPNKPRLEIDCQTNSKESFDEWIEALNKIFAEQNMLVNSLVNPSMFS